MHQSTISKLRSDLSKAHRERGKLSLALASSRDRANMRYLYLGNLMEVAIKNTKKGATREAHVKAHILANRDCVDNSLTLVDVEPLEVDAYEKLHEPDNVYDYVSEDDEDEEFLL